MLPPVNMRVSATLALDGYTLASFGGTQQQVFCGGVSAALGVSAYSVTILSVASFSGSGRRRRALQLSSGVSVAFSVAAVSSLAADYLQNSMVAFSTPAGGAALVSSLQQAGLSAVQGVAVLVPPAVLQTSSSPASDRPSSAAGSANVTVVAGAAGGGGGLLLLAWAAWWAIRRRKLAMQPGAQLAHAKAQPGPAAEARDDAAAPAAFSPPPVPPLPTTRFRYDVFLSYRRDDCSIVDLIEDKLCHCASCINQHPWLLRAC
jgi:hypothetical protein